MLQMPETYEEALEFLYQKLPMFSRIGDAALKKDLTNIRLFSHGLNDPQERFKSIHIAGTNGKGSVSHMMAAILQKSGYKTGLYTSPHLKDFRERIRVNGEMISRDFVVFFIRKNFNLINDIVPSFFELTVALAFDWFAYCQVDVAVVETGLGGRLDSTNILLPEISIITNISWDHQHILGDTLAAIAGEKAGIIKERVPVVIGELSSQTQDVFVQKAALSHAPLHFAEKEWQVVKVDYGVEEMTIKLNDIRSPEHPALYSYILDTAGSYQEKNICTVLSAVAVLRAKGWAIEEDCLQAGLAGARRITGLRGRWELLGTDPLIIADVGHNEAGIKEILRRLAMLTFRHLHVVTGFVKDKDVNQILRLLPDQASYYFCQARIPRALPSSELLLRASKAGLRGEAYQTVSDAYRAAKQKAEVQDLILICGSVFVVAEILP